MRQRPGSPNYYEGLDAKTASRRARAIKKRMRDRARGLVDYSPLPGDKGARTRKSRYSKTEEARAVREFMAMGFDFITSASMVSDIKPAILKQVLNRGRAAWATGGHRPGTTSEQWGRARVYSFISGGKTRHTADKDLWQKHTGIQG